MNIIKYSEIKNKKIVIHTIVILIYILSTSIKHTNIISILTSTISGLIICFYIIGDSINYLFNKYLNFNFNSIFGELSFVFLLSFSYYTFISIILCLKYLLNRNNICIVIISSVCIFYLFGIILNYNNKIEKTYNKNSKILPTIPVIIFGILLVIIFLKDYQWPSIPGWDVYVHLGNSNSIINNKGISNIFPNLKGNFIPYPYLFHILVSSISLFLNIEPYNIYWTAIFITIPLYGFLVYCITYLMNYNEIQSISAALIALTIFGGGGFLGPQYFYTSTVSLILFLNLLIILLDTRILTCSYLIIIIIFLFLFFILYPYPIIIVVPAFIYLILDKHHILSEYNDKFVNIYYLGFIGMVLINWKYEFIQDLDIKHNFSLSDKLNMLKQTYTDYYWIIFIIGSIYILYKLRIINKYLYKKSFNVMIYTLFLLILYFMPLSALRRVELYFRSFIAIISSFTIVWINDSLNILNKKIIIYINKHRLNIKKFNMLITFIFIIILISFLIQPYLYYSNKISNWSNLSKDEYLAAQWIKDNSPSKSYILTDPSTGKIFRGFTTRNCSTWFMINGQSIRGNHSLRRLIYEFFKEENPLKTYDYLERFPSGQCLIVITTRTSSWIKTNINKTYCAPTSTKIIPFPGMEKFSTPFFTLLNSWDTVKIYELSEAT